MTSYELETKISENMIALRPACIGKYHFYLIDKIIAIHTDEKRDMKYFHLGSFTAEQINHGLRPKTWDRLETKCRQAIEEDKI